MIKLPVGYFFLVLAFTISLGSESAHAESAVENNWGIELKGFFGLSKKNQPMSLWVYARSDAEKFLGAVGSTRRGWNTSFHMVDLNALSRVENSLKGTASILLIPDPWIPTDQKPITCKVELEGKIDEQNKISGTFKLLSKDSEDRSVANIPASGEIAGDFTPGGKGLTIPEKAMVELTIYNGLVGGAPSDNQRRLRVLLNFEGGKVRSGVVGQISMQHQPFDLTAFKDETATLQLTSLGLQGKVSIPYLTMEAQPVVYDFEMSSTLIGGLLAGGYDLEVKGSAQPIRFKGGFDGKWREGHAAARGVIEDKPWFLPVANWKPIQPGEHPRLFFRKDDLPALRARAETPEGRKIIARLKELLGGGESMPTSFNPSRDGFRDGASVEGWKPQTGSFSISHAAGFGFLYQLTGEAQYAELARKCIELSMSGQRDFDNRYSLIHPAGELRAGPSLGWHAVAYDLCYEAWAPEFRIQFAQFLQNYRNPRPDQHDEEGISLRRLALAPRQGPNSNHFGPVVGGAGLAVLAIKGDPGTDPVLLENYDRVLQRGVIRNLSGGFGDGGWFYEGQGPGQISSDTAFVPYLQALKKAAGRDYVAGSRNAQFITMLRVYELVGSPVVYPYRSSMGGTYGTQNFYKERNGLSRSGQFCQGFGAVLPTQRPALQWCFETYVEPDPQTRTFDLISNYPHRPMLALINWPFDEQAVNPGEILPKVHRDTIYGYYVFRNEWKDKDDIVVTALLENDSAPKDVLVFGLSEKLRVPTVQGKVKSFRAGQDGSGILAAGNGSLIVDFSKASGAEALILSIGTAMPKKIAEVKGNKAHQQILEMGETTPTFAHKCHFWVFFKIPFL